MSRDFIWVEKYRPKKLAEFVGNPDLKETFRKWIEMGECQHCILAGPSGTGKTTGARILVREIRAECLELNASDERGIDVIRDKVKRYASIQTHGRLKIILLDEADYLTPDSQTALRGIIEKYTRGTRFILTCNYLNKLLDPIQSRCKVIKLTRLPKNEIIKRLARILEWERYEWNNPKTKRDLIKLVNLYYPDMRRMISTLQYSSHDVDRNKEKRFSINFDYVINKDYRLKIIDLVKKGNWREIRQILANEAIDETEIFRFLFDGFDNPRVMLSVAEYMWRDAFVPDKEVNLMACILEICLIIKKD